MADNDEQQPPLHILFFPYLDPGHIIPMADMAVLFASRGVRCTIITTPVNAASIRSAVDNANDAFRGTDCPAIVISVVPFPDVGLPAGVENGTHLTARGDRHRLSQAVTQLREPFDQFLSDHHPDAVVSDSFYYWSADAAAEHGVPRVGFLGTSLFAGACTDSIQRYNPLETAPDDPDALVSLPGLPHRVEMRRSQMGSPGRRPPENSTVSKRVNAADEKNFGEVFNSFHKLEPGYAEHYRTTLGCRTWLVGPVALANKDMAGRGASVLSPDADSCMQWLDTKQPGSVVYVSFGSMVSFSPAELHELARGLDLSGKNFMWVVGGAGPSSSEWMPQGFADLVAPGGRGFIIRGWAPQILILNHPALGGFVTHCGWNSTLESVSAGVPMVTWPRFADQFYNEKLVVEVLKVGVSIGAKHFRSATQQVISGEVIAESIEKLMDNSEIQKMAKDLGVEARRAVENGGSSYNDVGSLMDELMARRRGVKIGEDK